MGEWRQEAELTAAGPGGAGQATGSSRNAWQPGGQWLTYESVLTLPGGMAYAVGGVVGLSPTADRYRAFAFSSFGIAIEYEGAWETADRLVFTSVGAGAGQAQVTYEQRPDGSVLFSAARRVADGSYETYFTSRLHH